MYFSCNGRVVALRFVIRTYVLGTKIIWIWCCIKLFSCRCGVVITGVRNI